MSKNHPADVAARVAFVSGGGSGIGEACCRTLASRGFVIGVSDIDIEAAERVSTEIVSSGGDALPVGVDVADEHSVEAAVDSVVRWGGGLHAAVNSAGVAAPVGQLSNAALADWERVLAVNLTGVFLCMRAEIRSMLTGTGGTIVNIGSVLSASASRLGTAAYVAAKHGVVGLTRQAAADHAADGIRVNVVLPGYVETELVRSRLSEQDRRVRGDQHLLGRLGRPEEISSMVAWLCCDEASFATGSQFVVDGGYLTI